MGGLCWLAVAGLGGCGASDGAVGDFGSYGTAAGELREPFGIAIDERNGDVYVVDTNNSRIERFTSAGAFRAAWGWGVADGRTEALQTCTTTCFPGLQGSGAGELEFPEGIAADNDPVSQSFGDVYVVDIDNRRVEKFSPTGAFLLMFGGGVNRSAREDHDRAQENVCPVDPDDVCGPGIEGSAGSQLELAVEGSFIAVGPGGTVYLGQRNSVKEFTPAGVYEAQIDLTPDPKPTGSDEVGGVSGLAVNGARDLYVIRHGAVGVSEYTSSGKLLRTLERGDEPTYDEGPTPALALDAASDAFIDVYTHERHRIDEYSASGVKLTSFDQGPEESPYIADQEDGLPGMAYDSRTKLLYLVNADVNVRPRVARVRVVRPPQR